MGSAQLGAGGWLTQAFGELEEDRQRLRDGQAITVVERGEGGIRAAFVGRGPCGELLLPALVRVTTEPRLSIDTEEQEALSDVLSNYPDAPSAGFQTDAEGRSTRHRSAGGTDSVDDLPAILPPPTPPGALRQGRSSRAHSLSVRSSRPTLL
ncbi:hypothetical protein [Streptomyces durhamensis]|uniref:hypothetical protein n=1 Tax=Streptomyces durhamensis TaxID=68194 RepID=UPI0012FF2AB2|nr:hypothetical protein [Streptomyces durhamensis]